MGIKVNKIDYISFAKFYGIISAIIGLLWGIFGFLASPIFGVLGIVLGLVGGAIGGFIGGLVFALLYNLIFNKVATFEVN